MQELHIVRLTGCSILDQLRMEEALLRADHRNWCILNDGTDDAIVLGISGKCKQLVCSQKLNMAPLPLIRRFSGGGTVLVDANTLFVTFILAKSAVPLECCYPQRIMEWSEELYRPVIGQPGFRLRENDYVLDQRKFGGNAQYLRKDRWLHHSTLLWDYDSNKMEYLLLPEKRPSYRQDRPHEQFLTRLKEHLPSRTHLFSRLTEELGKRFAVVETGPDEVQHVLQLAHRRATRVETIPGHLTKSL